jgi:electron-transferring-flavoprotein dehydrogenase
MTIRTLPLRTFYEPLLRLPRRQSGARTLHVPRPLALSRRPFHTTTVSKEREFHLNTIERESDQVDVCIVGGGPAGLSAAIRIKQLAARDNREIRVLLLEKGGEMGRPLIPSVLM